MPVKEKEKNRKMVQKEWNILFPAANTIDAREHGEHVLL
jgi:hypothetical protein